MIIHLRIRPRWKRVFIMPRVFRQNYAVFRRRHGRWFSVWYALRFTWFMVRS